MGERVVMTIEEIERVCDASEPQRWPSHELEAPDLQHCETFYPLGFPTELRTNSIEILAQARNLWSGVQERFHTQPIRVDLHRRAILRRWHRNLR